MRNRRGTRSGLAAVLALVVVATGAGFAFADPCAMHHHRAEGVQFSSAAHDPACHDDGQGLPCAALGACLSVSVAVPAHPGRIDGAGAELGSLVLPDGSFHSHTSPPLAPPPQA